MDIHGERPTAGRVPFLSPTLNCVTMPALVYLRTSFGFTLFRPRIIFFALSYGVGVMEYICWKEPAWWVKYRAACLFAGGAVILYWLHFGITFFRELYRKSEHDNYPGTSHLVRLIRLGGEVTPTAEMNIHLWAEPAFVLIVSAALRFAIGEHRLSAWLVFVSLCMFCKEALNYWTAIRRDKTAADITADARTRINTLDADKPIAEAPQATREAAKKMERRVSAHELKARRHAETLGISKPYELEEVEANYRDRIRRDHPDNHENSPESNQRTAELNEAVEFFRKMFGA